MNNRRISFNILQSIARLAAVILLAADRTSETNVPFQLFFRTEDRGENETAFLCQDIVLQQGVSRIRIRASQTRNSYDDCWCSLRSTYRPSDFRFIANGVNKDVNENSTIRIKIEGNGNGRSTVQLDEDEGYRAALPLNVRTGNDGFLDIKCGAHPHPSFTTDQLQLTTTVTTTTSTTTTSTTTSTTTTDATTTDTTTTEHTSDNGTSKTKMHKGDSNSKSNTTIIAIVVPIVVLAIIVISVVAIVLVLRRHKNNIKKKSSSGQGDRVVYADINARSLAPRDPEVLAKEQADFRARQQANDVILNYADLDFVSSTNAPEPSPYGDGPTYAEIGVEVRSNHNTLGPNESEPSPYELDNTEDSSGLNSNSTPHSIPVYAKVVKNR